MLCTDFHTTSMLLKRTEPLFKLLDNSKRYLQVCFYTLYSHFNATSVFVTLEQNLFSISRRQHHLGTIWISPLHLSLCANTVSGPLDQSPPLAPLRQHHLRTSGSVPSTCPSAPTPSHNLWISPLHSSLCANTISVPLDQSPPLAPLRQHHLGTSGSVPSTRSPAPTPSWDLWISPLHSLLCANTISVPLDQSPPLAPLRQHRLRTSGSVPSTCPSAPTPSQDLWISPLHSSLCANTVSQPLDQSPLLTFPEPTTSRDLWIAPFHSPLCANTVSGPPDKSPPLTLPELTPSRDLWISHLHLPP